MLPAALAAFLAFTAAAHAAQAMIAPEDAKTHVGETVTVEGVVDAVHHGHGGNIFLNLGGIYPHNAFTGYVPPGSAKAFKDVDRLEGQTVDLTGTITLYRGHPEIVLTVPSQLGTK